jgi:hypothetical protein
VLDQCLQHSVTLVPSPAEGKRLIVVKHVLQVWRRILARGAKVEGTDPPKVADVDRLLGKFYGKEKEVLEAARRKYEPHLLEKERQENQSRHAVKQVTFGECSEFPPMSGGSAGGSAGGQGIGQDQPQQPHGEGANGVAKGTERAEGEGDVRAQLIRFYKQHDPQRAADIGAHVDHLLLNFSME